MLHLLRLLLHPQQGLSTSLAILVLLLVLSTVNRGQYLVKIDRFEKTERPSANSLLIDRAEDQQVEEERPQLELMELWELLLALYH